MARPKSNGKLKQVGGTGAWYFFFTENGRSKRISTGTTVYKEALEWQLGREKGAEEAKADEGRWTIQQAVDYYNRNHLEIGDVYSPDQVRARIKNVADYLGWGTFIDKLTPTNFSDYRIKRRAMPGSKVSSRVKDSTVFTELTSFKACLNFCVKEEAYLGKVPYIKIGKQSDPKDRWLTDREADQLLKAMQGGQTSRLSACHRFAAIALGTGKRKRAIETLQWPQVDFENGMIDFRIKGRDRESSKLRGLSAISPWLYPILKEAYDQRLNSYVLDSPGHRGGQFRQIASKIGMRDVTPHTLRHTWGTRAAQKGLTLFEIAQAMGITQKTAEKNYIHHCEEFQKAAALKGQPTEGIGKVELPDRGKERRRIIKRRGCKKELQLPGRGQDPMGI